ncbi:hypothetical protein J2X35_003989 [Mesorhizobium sp. BE184]|nr:hypothetical protein [Mesorhizobium sp. BE184]
MRAGFLGSLSPYQERRTDEAKAREQVGQRWQVTPSWASRYDHRAERKPGWEASGPVRS